MLERHMKEYIERVKTGQDLIDMGVIPKTSSEHLALIAVRRLQALKTQVLASITDEMLGAWMPAVEPTIETKEVREISNPQDILRNIQLGMHVLGVGQLGNNNFTGLEGIVRTYESDGSIGVEFDKATNGSDLGGKCQPGKGYTVPAPIIKLVFSQPYATKVATGYTLAKGVVADKRLGHIVRFTADYAGQMRDTTDGRQVAIQIPKGTVGRLTEYTAEKGWATFSIEENLPNQGNRRHFGIALQGAYGKLSSTHSHGLLTNIGKIPPSSALQGNAIG